MDVINIEFSNPFLAILFQLLGVGPKPFRYQREMLVLLYFLVLVLILLWLLIGIKHALELSGLLRPPTVDQATPVRSDEEWEDYMIRHDGDIASVWGSHLVKLLEKDIDDLRAELATAKNAQIVTGEVYHAKLAWMRKRIQRMRLEHETFVDEIHTDIVKVLVEASKKDPRDQLLSPATKERLAHAYSSEYTTKHVGKAWDELLGNVEEWHE